MKSLSRRNLLKSMSMVTGGVLASPLMGLDDWGRQLHMPEIDRHAPLSKPVTAITLGAGNRGNVYGNYAAKYGDRLDIVGVAEPIKVRNDKYCELHNIDEKNSFVTWEHVFEVPKFADAIIITTPDDLHYGPCMKALAMGYDVLLEKPIAPTEEECRDIRALAQKTGRIVAVCHVLRYAPYFINLRKLIQSGSIGELMSIAHFEPIEHVHMAHSFVRGKYSAMKIYHRDRQRTYVCDLPDDKSKHEEAILEYLRTTNYGRCVYQMENDQPDHYVAKMQFAGGITAAFSMEAFTSYHGRRTRIMGSHGDIVGDMNKYIHTDFLTGEKTEWSMTSDGHGGGDWNLAADWVQAVAKQDKSLLSSSIGASIESHLMAFGAERSRLEGKIENINI